MTPEMLAAQFGLNTDAKSYLLEKWNPDCSGDIDIVIKSDGRWIHEGGEIKRSGLVRLFASILKKEGEDHYLVTPVEKWRIQVEDAPLHVLSVQRVDEGLQALISDGRLVAIDSSSSLRLEALGDIDLPVMDVRFMRARFLRQAYYSLCEEGVLNEDSLVIDTYGCRFNLPF
ncbi:MAG: DUF1285 domain-containing protein [Thalassolituus sp.]